MEFQWLGLILFVSMSFLKIEAWASPIITSVLDMPFWSAISANFFGIVLAALSQELASELQSQACHHSGCCSFPCLNFYMERASKS